MELKRVVITGIGAISPLGATARETWEAVVAGEEWGRPHHALRCLKVQDHVCLRSQGI